MNLPEYDEFLETALDNGHDLGDPHVNDAVHTMAQHIHALQHRITDLNGCACAYDHPADVCLIHIGPEKTRALWEEGKLP